MTVWIDDKTGKISTPPPLSAEEQAWLKYNEWSHMGGYTRCHLYVPQDQTMRYAFLVSLYPTSKLGEIVAGVALWPETASGSTVLILDGIDGIQACFRGKPTCFEKICGYMTEDEIHRTVWVKDFSLSVVMIGSSLPGMGKPISMPTFGSYAKVAPGKPGMFSKAKDWYYKGAENDAAWRELTATDKLYYEIGQKTFNSAEKFGPYANLDAVARGRAYVKDFGWYKAIVPEKAGVKLGIGTTFETGPTPAFRWLLPRAAVTGGVGTATYYFWPSGASTQNGNSP